MKRIQEGQYDFPAKVRQLSSVERKPFFFFKETYKSCHRLRPFTDATFGKLVKLL